MFTLLFILMVNSSSHYTATNVAFIKKNYKKNQVFWHKKLLLVQLFFP